MEILAPVGSLENLKIAINHGADAVYLSAGKFNARSKCQDISLKNLQECVNYAHLFNVKVYLTVNTIVKNSELDQLFTFLKGAVESKVDAFIIQDLATYFILKNCFKNVCLHASTQMGIHNLDGAKFLESLGFSRVVLSRETTLEDIKQISKNTNLEIEFFVQGALCIAFSGNCYFSSLTNNTSGNRGECSQLCRLKYTAQQNNKFVKNGYLLSAKDMCLIHKLKELEEAGVCSLKIEGRLRRGAYVAQAIDSYKKALSGKCDYKTEEHNLKKVFSRGDYTEGYLYGNKDIVSNYQNHIGIKIGKVINVKPFKNLHKITIVSNNYQIKKGDGLKFLLNGEQQSLGVGNVDVKNNQYTIYSVNKPKVNSIVYLTLDNQNETNLIGVTKKLPVDIFVKLCSGEKLEATIKYKDITETIVDSVVEPAKSSPLEFNEVFNTFNKLNNTNFYLNNFNCKINNAFVVKSKLNALRRNLIENLKNKIINNYNKQINSQIIVDDYKKLLKNKKPPNKVNYCIFNKYAQIENLSTNNIYVYAPIKYDLNLMNLELNKIPNNYIIYLYLPIIANFRDIKIIDEILNNNKRFSGVMANNYWGLKYNKNYKVVANYTFNIANDISSNVLLNYADDFIYSVEKQLVSVNKQGKYFNGKVALMTFAHCPQKTLYNKSCEKNCEFKNHSYVSENGKTYLLRRTIISTCYFELVNCEKTTFDAKYFCYDLR